MAYGFKVWDASGNVLLNSPDLATRVRYYKEVAAGNSDNVTLSDISGKTTYAFSMPLEVNKLAHDVAISGTTFTWTAKSDATFSSSKSLVGVILAS